MTLRNVYEDATRADAYSRLEFPGTYFLAFRDLPSLLERHVTGGRSRTLSARDETRVAPWRIDVLAARSRSAS